jgi:ABC-type lipoprotein release transport system permease subunit
MVYVAPMALLALVLIAPAALIVANLLAALPGRRAARLRPAEVLRTE